MAVQNEIQVGRFNRALQKLLSMKGPASMNTLAPELMPVIAFSLGVETRYLETWERFAVTVVVAAQAALQVGFRVRNPTGSNMVAVVEKWNVFGTVADQPVLSTGAATTDLPSALPLTNARFDVRGRPNPTLIASTGNQAGFGLVNKEQCAFAANGTYDFILDDNQEISILPGDCAMVVSNIVNTALLTSFVWRERFLEDSERA